MDTFCVVLCGLWADFLLREVRTQLPELTMGLCRIEEIIGPQPFVSDGDGVSRASEGEREGGGEGEGERARERAERPAKRTEKHREKKKQTEGVVLKLAHRR
jgi:hypothetical protein